MLFARRRIRNETLVVEALSARDDMTGNEIAKATGLWVGSLYPALMRMEQSGRITSRWETETPRPDGSARRRLYALPERPVRH
jgi:DNA-binding PadR family transcriptional regulator